MSDREIGARWRATLRELGYETIASDPALDALGEALARVLGEATSDAIPAAEAWDAAVAGLDPRRAARTIAARWLVDLEDESPGTLRGIAFESTTTVLAIIDALRGPSARRLATLVRAAFPELAALATAADPAAAVEHEKNAGPSSPLLDHVERAFDRKLAGLERADRARFQHDDALGAAAFAEEVARLERLRGELLICVRAALLHLDFAKGGDPGTRDAWSAGRVPLDVHNLAARAILERRLAHESGTLAGEPHRDALVLALIESHGLTGQAVRGETPRIVFARWIRRVRELRETLAAKLGVSREQAARAMHDALHLVNLCDTAAVREGLYTDALRAEMIAIEDDLARLAAASGTLDEAAIERELSLERRGPSRQHLADRLARLRKGRIDRGEPRADVERAISALGDAAVERLDRLLAPAQLWYCEAGTAALDAPSQLRVIALALAAAERGRPDVARPYHVTLLPLVDRLHTGSGDPRVPYRVRLIETLLGPLSVEAILDGARPSGALGALETEIGGGAAIAVRFDESEEASALLTLLPIYEKKSSAAFHSTLKTLCDLYGLRKDEFDRVANEEMYLATMNAAKSDKARMVEHCRPGRIVEVGPGGGVVLDLLAERFPDSEIIGLDVSKMVVDALEEKRAREGRRWRVIEADAFEMPSAIGEASADSVVYCSVLHEIYSYCEHEGRRYRLEPVAALLRASWKTLKRGGRLVIRDGVMPPRGQERLLRLLAPDAREMLDLYVAQFEGRPIRYAEEPDGRIRMSAEDAMAFMYTYNWGPASFPYEVREQYGVLPYDEYRDAILGWLGSDARVVPLPPAERSYLQPGYVEGLRGKIDLFDATGTPCRLPDSNALWVFEKA